MDYISKYVSPIGDITLVSDGNYLTGLFFDGQKYFGSTLHEKYEERDLDIFVETRKWLDLYFGKRKPDFIPPIKLEGTAFRKQVWDILLEIPYGKVETYGSISKRLNKPKMSAQAVGQAVGHNPISIIVPCHRVIGSNFSITGYAGGIDKKLKLLELEGYDISSLK